MTNSKKQRIAVATSREPVNVKSLETLACLSGAERCCWPGWDVSIRTVIQALLSGVQDDGCLGVSWHEGGIQGLGFNTRRYSGGGQGVSGRSLFVCPEL